MSETTLTNDDKPFREQKWHLNKSLSAGHLITTAALTITIVAMVITTDRRIEANRAAGELSRQVTQQEIEKNQIRIAAVEMAASRANSQMQSDRVELRSQLSRIEDKLNRYIERGDD